jgi:hypothetical protein
MKLHRIILATVALLPFNMCKGMEDARQLTRPIYLSVESRPAPKKYRRLLPPKKVPISAPKIINNTPIMLTIESPVYLYGPFKTVPTKEQEKAQQMREHKEKQQHIRDQIIEAQKKERAAKAAQKKPILKQPEPGAINHLAQRLTIKRNLIKEKKCQTEAQLKKKLRSKCRGNPCCGEYINSHTVWHYEKKTNTLEIFIGDETDNYFCQDCDDDSEDDDSEDDSSSE